MYDAGPTSSWHWMNVSWQIQQTRNVEPMLVLGERLVFFCELIKAVWVTDRAQVTSTRRAFWHVDHAVTRCSQHMQRIGKGVHKNTSLMKENKAGGAKYILKRLKFDCIILDLSQRCFRDLCYVCLGQGDVSPRHWYSREPVYSLGPRESGYLFR